MPIPERTISRWSQHQASTAFTQSHLLIREALDDYSWPADIKYEVFLQGSYKNDTNLGGDSDVDVVVRLNQPAQAARGRAFRQATAGGRLPPGAYQRWKSLRDHALKAMRAGFGDAAKSGRKTLKVPKGRIPADADLVVTVSYKESIGFYLSDERRWVVSFPQQHHDQGEKKEEATGRRFKRTIRMFKAARNWLVEKKVLTKDDAPSYFIECLLYNVPDGLFNPDLAPTYTGILGWLRKAELKEFVCQNGQVPLFGRGREQWSQEKARKFVKALQELWEAGAESGTRQGDMLANPRYDNRLSIVLTQPPCTVGNSNIVKLPCLCCFAPLGMMSGDFIWHGAERRGLNGMTDERTFTVPEVARFFGITPKLSASES